MRHLSLNRWPKVSVVVPALNEEREIGECLASLAHQTFSDFEVIVVDNGSSDATVSVARSYGARVIHEPRRGPGYAREAGFQAARADIIAATDADTVVPPDWLARIHRAFEEDPEVIAVFGPFQAKPSSAPTVLGNHLLPVLEIGVVVGQRMAWRTRVPLFSGANFALRRDAFHKVRGFRSLRSGHIYASSEDILLGSKLRRLGKVRYLPDLVVWTSARKVRPLSPWTLTLIGDGFRMAGRVLLGEKGL
ncbi:MAG: glycosyltransferase [Candidatus Acetothermia bacterium]|jgi:glycosyltransferase involved in cell wall biosynthesis|nr:glycosyltransferase [Candidatus Acetothermia bacterium]